MKDIGIVQGSEYWARPLLVEKDTVYIHTDIERLPDTEDYTNMWQYHEYQYGWQEFLQNLGIEADDTSDTVDLTLGITEYNRKDIKLIAEQASRFQQLTLQSADLTDSQKMEVADLYPLWAELQEYPIGQVVKWGWNDDNESQLYECLQGHTSQADWKPNSSPSLWKKIGFDPESGIPIWTQPLGASDSYQKGDQVEHNGKIWQSDYDNNVWEPGIFGWSEV